MIEKYMGTVTKHFPEIPSHWKWMAWEDSPNGYPEVFLRLRNYDGLTIMTMGEGRTAGTDADVLKLAWRIAERAGDMSHAQRVYHQVAKAHLERHSDALEAHKRKGPIFAAAVEQLQARVRSL